MKRIVRAAVLAAFAWAMGIAHGHHGADPARELPLWQVGLVVAAVALAVGVAGGSGNGGSGGRRPNAQAVSAFDSGGRVAAPNRGPEFGRPSRTGRP